MKPTFLKFGQLCRANPSPLDQETSFGLLLSEGAKEQTTTAGEAFPVFHRAGRDQTCVFCIFLLQSHRDMMCFQSPDWRFKWSVHFLRGLSVFLKSHELFQVVSVGAGTILANGTELNILPLGPGVITYLPPWKLVWVHSFPRRWAWTSCQGGLVDMLCRYYHIIIESKISQNPSKCWQSDSSSPSTCTFCRRMLYLCIFLLVVPFVPLLQQLGRLVTKFAFAMEMRWATKIAVESETHRLFSIAIAPGFKTK